MASFRCYFSKYIEHAAPYSNNETNIKLQKDLAFIQATAFHATLVHITKRFTISTIHPKKSIVNEVVQTNGFLAQT